MPEYESLVGSYVHLAKEPRANEALHTLKKVASLVKPIMRARGWKVGQLAEFYPNQANLLGLNVNRGMKICLRLRYPGDRTQFLPLENVVDTMLHELAHNVHGPHNQQFHALWDQLRDECQGLMMKGYTGEGFLSEGRRLGGARMPDREVRRLAREAAEKRRGQSILSAGSGQRLGGAAPRPGQDMRHVIASAAARRNAVLQGCGSERFNDREIHEIADTATRNGFRTQAEEDEANEAAIAQALWELVQEDEKAKYGQSYVRPSAEHPEGKGGGRSRTLAGVEAGGEGPNGRGLQATSGSLRDDKQPRASSNDEYPGSWVCEACTLHNQPSFLCCDACGSERPSMKRPEPRNRAVDALPNSSGSKSETATIDLTANSPPKKKRQTAQRPKKEASAHPASPPSSSDSVPFVWICSFCGTAMERRWWTCSLCGKMKESSK